MDCFSESFLFFGVLSSKFSECVGLDISQDMFGIHHYAMGFHARVFSLGNGIRDKLVKKRFRLH